MKRKKTSITLKHLDENIIRERVEYFYNLGIQYYSECLNWYDDEFNATAKFCHEVNPKFTLIQWCGVISSLSPSTLWQKNKDFALMLCELTQTTISDTETLYNSGIRCLFSLNLKKALACLSVEQDTLQESSILKILNAQKTSHFFLNGFYPESETGATLDSHMGQIFCPEIIGAASFTKAAYIEAEIIFSRIAREKSLLTHELQALCWCAKVHGVPRPQQLKFDLWS
ncbi:MAG: hypothetical protein IM526_02985 [Microcystis sp. M38BS1]|uniref:DUF7178 family protein n=1 Tax=Microcystis sp. M38BS1 TaxID=2771188 RepID=UPI0031FD1421|nr:hypothetical protein [Microcystis sp. M38BS1]MCA6582628.1 hypothetical protein [Pseudanabaena sp. M34BS1SP1A06MG]